jgi:ribosomal protein S18 acetylase RimI-like enzyme
MRHAETRASHAGLRRLALTVAVDNAPAISLYERLGFEIVGASKFPSLEHRIGYPGFFRMRKAIS